MKKATSKETTKLLRQTAAVAIAILLVASSSIAVYKYSQASDLQNQLNVLKRSLNLAQLTLSNIIISPNGSLTGTNNIQRAGDLYVLTDNISGSITVQKGNIIIDGAGYTLQGYGGTGIDLTNSGITQFPSSLETFNVTVKNLRIMDFNVSVYVRGGGNHTFYQDYIGRTVPEVTGGVFLFWTHSGNNVTRCTIFGSPTAIGMELSGGNSITENNLSGDVWLQMGGGGVFDGNYWSDYLTKYTNATEVGSSGIGDTPYVYNVTEHVTGTHQDNHPIMKPLVIPFPTPSYHPAPPVNPIDMYVSGLPTEIVDRLIPLGNKGYLNGSELNLIFALDKLQTYANNTVVKTYLNSSTVVNALDEILKDGAVTDAEVAAFQDLDHDYISNAYEVERFHTDPTKMDTSGLGIDDFNAIFTYSLDPNNKTQIQQFLASVPNVSANQLYLAFGGLESVSGHAPIVEVSIRDPLIKYLAKTATITWDASTKRGHLLVNGTPIWSSYDYGGTPAYYFTHGRVGRCDDSTLATLSILGLMGYKTLELSGQVPANGTIDSHFWCETVVEGKVYVVNYGELIPREGFYQKNGWVISDSSNYNPNWYLN